MPLTLRAVKLSLFVIILNGCASLLHAPSCRYRTEFEAQGFGPHSVMVMQEDGTCEVFLEGPHVTNINFLSNWPLRSLCLQDTSVSDLTTLRTTPLDSLTIYGTNTLDLSQLEGLPLAAIALHGPSAQDLTPLGSLPLTDIVYTPFHVRRGHDVLNHIPTLKRVTTVDEHGTPRWMDYERWRREIGDKLEQSPDK